jgi:hypothetical protein
LFFGEPFFVFILIFFDFTLGADMRFLDQKTQEKITAKTKAIESVASRRLIRRGAEAPLYLEARTTAYRLTDGLHPTHRKARDGWGTLASLL